MAKRHPRTNHKESAMARALDRLAEFDSFTTEVAPILRQAIKEGWTADQIQQDPKIQALLVARQLSIALMEGGKNTGAALSAITDARNRITGKPVESRNVKMTLQDAPDEQLDAKLKALLSNEEESDATDELPN